MLYFIFVIFVLLFAYLGDPKVTSKKNSFYFRCLLVLILAYMIGLGGGLAADNADYRAVFRNLPEFSQLGIDSIGTFFFERYEKGEYGFLILSLFIKKLGFSSVGVCFVLALITNLLIVKTYYRFQNPLLIFVLFLSSTFFAQEPNLIRQILAISIFIFSLGYIVEKNWKKYLLCVLVMFVIHNSSIITVLFLPFCFNLNIHRILKIVFIGLWTGSILIALGKIVIDLTGVSMLMLGSEGYDAYLTDENRIGSSAQHINVVYNALTFLYFIYGKDKKEKNVYAYCFILGAIFQNISVQFINLYRMSLYFSAISPAVISEMIYDFIHDKSSKKLLWHGISIITILLYLRSLIIVSISNSEIIGKEMSSFLDIF